MGKSHRIAKKDLVRSLLPQQECYCKTKHPSAADAFVFVMRFFVRISPFQVGLNFFIAPARHSFYGPENDDYSFATSQSFPIFEKTKPYR